MTSHWEQNSREAMKTDSLNRRFTIVSWLCGSILLFQIVSRAQTVTQFASGLGTPTAGAVLIGTAVNPNTGHPVRHLWSGDNDNGLCRLDPDVDTPGNHTINPATCIKIAAGIKLVPGQAAFDGANNLLYVIDGAGKSTGVFRFHYTPGAGNGHGAMNSTVEVLGGVSNGNGVCGIGSNGPTATAIGPDGNLYVGFSKVSNIMRIVAPQAEPLPCSNVQPNIATISNSQNDLGLGWILHDLFGDSTFDPVRWPNADSCFTPQNGFVTCPASNFFNVIVPAGLLSDQTYPALNGNTLYYWTHTEVERIANISNSTGPVITLNFGGGFQFIGALAVDRGNPAGEVLYVGDDPGGLGAGTGLWHQIVASPPPAPPGTPTNVTTSPGDSQATVTWTPAPDGQPVTSFTVHNSLASNGVRAPDVLITASAGSSAVPTTATVTGLTNGASYQFEVSAANALGSSALSAPSNLVVPQPVTVPAAPMGVVGLAGNAQVLLAWSAPSNGGSPITSYTVTALVGGVPAGISATAPGTATGATVSGLTNGTAYTFTVHAMNAIGSGPESAPSAPLTPTAPPASPDVSLTMTGPASVTFGANGVYALTVTNNSPVSDPSVVVTDVLPSIGAALISAVPSQGTCQLADTSLTCSLGSLAAGATASINVTLTMFATGTSQASAVIDDAAGNPLTDPTPGDNSASVTTAISAPSSTTDIQVTGSTQNGGPAVGTSDTYTWQIKNGSNQMANAVAFSTTLPSNLPLISASSPQGTCIGPTPGKGGVISCGASNIAVGQTMVVTVNVSLPVQGSVTVTGTATFSGSDTNAANNSFPVTIQVK